MQEQEFFSADNVYVSQQRFVAHGQTYAMSAVTSVSSAEVRRSQLGPLLLGAIGSFLILVGCFGAPFLLVLGLVSLAITGCLVAAQTREYAVQLSMSSGQVSALKSPDRELIANVVQALNNAIVARG